MDPRKIGAIDRFHSSSVGRRSRIRTWMISPGFLLFHGGQHDLRDPEEPHGDREEFHPLTEFADPEGEPRLIPWRWSVPIVAEAEAQEEHDHVLDERTAAQADEEDETDRADGEEFRRPELQGGIGQERGGEHEADDADRARPRRIRPPKRSGPPRRAPSGPSCNRRCR